MKEKLDSHVTEKFYKHFHPSFTAQCKLGIHSPIPAGIPKLNNSERTCKLRLPPNAFVYCRILLTN